MTLIKKFYQYQKERFPLIILGVSFLPAVLSSGVVTTGGASVIFVLASLVVSFTYLLHVRIIDEHRDVAHDRVHYKERPVSRGSITLLELQRIDWFIVGILLLTTIFFSREAIFCAAVMLIYSFLAQKEFFIGDVLRQRFFLYNAVNLIQMLLLQVLIYILAKNVLEINTVLVFHFLFTASGTIIFEFLRKLKIPGNDGTGKDTYTWFLGFKKALFLYSFFVLANMAFFVKVMLIQGGNPVSLAGIVTAIIFISIFLQYRKQTAWANQIMQLVFLVAYSVLNLAIFFSV